MSLRHIGRDFDILSIRPGKEENIFSLAEFRKARGIDTEKFSSLALFP